LIDWAMRLYFLVGTVIALPIAEEKKFLESNKHLQRILIEA
jgi:hypothetical protein